MLEETVILGGNQRIDHRWGNLGQLDPFAIGLLELGQLLAIGIQDLGRPLHGNLADIADAGRERDQDQHIEQQQHRQRDQQADRRAPPHVAQPPPGQDDNRQQPREQPGHTSLGCVPHRSQSVHGHPEIPHKFILEASLGRNELSGLNSARQAGNATKEVSVMVRTRLRSCCKTVSEAHGP